MFVTSKQSSTCGGLLALLLFTITLFIGQTAATPSQGDLATFQKRDDGIWRPAVNATWQIVLLNPLDLAADATSVVPDVDIFDIDLFTTDVATIDTLHRLGKKVICYFSAGSYEPRTPDSSQFDAADLGSVLKGWPDERWLNLKSDKVRKIMQARLQLAKDKHCDAVDPDNMDAYNNGNGLKLTAQDSIDFTQYLSTNARALGLGIGLKNAAAILKKVILDIDFVVNEQCVQFSECARFAPSIDAGKPVFHIEYPSEVTPEVAAQFCSETGIADGAHGFSTAIKNMGLDGWIRTCK